MVKNFQQYLLESKDGDFKISDLFSTLSRNYASKKTFYTDQTQFEVIEERRDWGDIRKKAELEKSKTNHAFYKLVFRHDEKKYLLEINFDMTYIGKKEKDAPETASQDDLARLNSTLEKIVIKQILFKADGLDYSTSSPSSSVKIACEKFMIKMLADDYDSLSNEIYSIEQT